MAAIDAGCWAQKPFSRPSLSSTSLITVAHLCGELFYVADRPMPVTVLHQIDEQTRHTDL